MRHARRNEPLIYVRELERSDVTRLVELETLCHPPEVRDGIDLFDTMLGSDWYEWPMPYGHAVSGYRPIRLGLGVGTELVGYMIGRRGEADDAGFVHVDDIAILPDQRRHLFRLLAGFFSQHALWYADTPVMGHAYEAVTKLYERHRRVTQRMGLALVRIEPVSDWTGSEPLYRARWEPTAARRAHARVSGRPGKQRAVAATAAAPLDAAGTVRVNGIDYEVALARTVAQWESLAGEWDALLNRVPGPTAFQTFGFLRLWWDHFGVSGSPFIVVLRRAGAAAGIAPLAVFPVTIHGHAVRQLGFIGSRWEIDRPQFLFAGAPGDGQAEACAQALGRTIAARRDDWDTLYLYEQAPESNVIAALARSLRKSGYLLGQLPDSTCPYIRTEGDWDAFLDTRSRSLRKNLQRGLRRLEREGQVAYRVVNDAPAVDTAFDTFLEIEAQSWKADTDAGLRSNAVDQAFYRELTSAVGCDRRIEFRFIDVAGRPAAGTFGIRHERYFYSLKIAHDQRFAAASPGTLLESLEIRDCFGGDVVEYDFLGGFLTNKSRWTDDARTTVQVFALPRRGHWIPFYIDRFVLRPRVKQLLRRTGWLEPMLGWHDRLKRRLAKTPPESSETGGAGGNSELATRNAEPA